MILDLTHGDLSACPCGAGKPDVTLLMPNDAKGHCWITCDLCSTEVGAAKYTDAATVWNGLVMQRLAGAVA